MSTRDMLTNALRASWSIVDAEGDADFILSALHSAGYVIERDWQPTKTAPEDSRQVMATFKGQFGWVVFVAYAHPGKHGGVSAPGYAKPTHWRPLPTPPKETPDAP